MRKCFTIALCLTLLMFTYAASEEKNWEQPQDQWVYTYSQAGGSLLLIEVRTTGTRHAIDDDEGQAYVQAEEAAWIYINQRETDLLELLDLIGQINGYIIIDWNTYNFGTNGQSITLTTTTKPFGNGFIGAAEFNFVTEFYTEEPYPQPESLRSQTAIDA